MRYCLYIICILLVFSCKDKSQNETIKLNEETVMKEVDSAPGTQDPIPQPRIKKIRIQPHFGISRG